MISAWTRALLPRSCTRPLPRAGLIPPRRSIPPVATAAISIKDKGAERSFSRCAPNGIKLHHPSFHSPLRFVSTSASGLGDSTGLFDNPELCTPSGFDSLTTKAIDESSNLVQEISEKVDNPDIEIIRKFDELSDTLCRVADLAECIRQVHPDSETVEEAQNACIVINNYVEELNTNISLHRVLKNVIESEQFSTFDEVTQRTAESFMHDFEISGIHLEEAKREEAVKLHNTILELSHEFVRNTTQPVIVDKNECPAFLTEKFPSDSKHVMIDHVPRLNPDSKLRALSYIAYYSVLPTQQQLLESLLSLRNKLALLVGYPTFSHRVIKSSMAGDPDIVSEFLKELSAKILPLAREETKQMHSLKLEAGDQVDLLVLRPWDVMFVTSLAQKKCFPDGLSGIENWFSLEDCLSGLGNLFCSLFGVKLEPVSVKDGEVWDPAVKKLAFVHEKEGLLGYTYCDLYAREGKLAFDCHYTIQGGREISDGTYQLPVIALCCNFRSPLGGRPALLPRQSVENLFHEMGHALHSMLGRPKYQNVTGTRCSTDFAEVPSILMEYFLNDSRVLSSFARHHSTGEPLPETLVRGFQLSHSYFPASDIQMQIVYAMMDQKFHGKHPLGKSTVDLYAELHREYAPLDHVPQTAWFLRFNHLYGYAAKYYSYLWSRAVASLIWNSCFQSDPFSREMGDRYREMLKYGGGIHPRTLVRDMLGFEPTVADLVGALHSDVVKHQNQVAKMCA